MHKLVLLRHGESSWNLENRFTGWTDVDLSPKGVEEAREAGRVLKEAGYAFDVAHTSLLRRAIRTLWLTLDGLDQLWIPVRKTWRLNERHYGALQGLDKGETAAKFGEALVKILRRSYADPPPALTPRTHVTPGATRVMPVSRPIFSPSLNPSRRPWSAWFRTGTTRSCRISRRARGLSSRPTGTAFGRW